MKYQLIIPDEFRDVMRTKDQRLQKRLVVALRQLAGDTPWPNGLRVKKMQGVADVWEASIDRSNRITFEFQGGAIILRNNCNHAILDKHP